MFYSQARVAISPMRYGAGVKLKTIEALQFGVPIVATSVGSEGIETFGTGAMNVTDDPREFAEAVAALVDDRDRWEAQRRRTRSFRTTGRTETKELRGGLWWIRLFGVESWRSPNTSRRVIVLTGADTSPEIP